MAMPTIMLLNCLLLYIFTGRNSSKRTLVNLRVCLYIEMYIGLQDSHSTAQHTRGKIGGNFHTNFPLTFFFILPSFNPHRMPHNGIEIEFNTKARESINIEIIIIKKINKQKIELRAIKIIKNGRHCNMMEKFDLLLTLGKFNG